MQISIKLERIVSCPGLLPSPVVSEIWIPDSHFLLLSEILMVLRHVQTPYSSPLSSPYPIVNFTILLSISQQPNEEKEVVCICLWINISSFIVASYYLVVTIWLWDLVAPNSDYRIVRIWQQVSVATQKSKTSRWVSTDRPGNWWPLL